MGNPCFSDVSGMETLANVEEGDPIEDVVEGEILVKVVSEGKPLF